MEPPRPSVNVHDKLTEGGAYRYRVAFPEMYTHTHRADGGFWSMSFTVGGDVLDADEWLADGPLRHIVVYDDALGVCWEGFVNDVKVNYGPLTVTRGPVLDIANRVDVYYSEVDNATTPPTVGMRNNVGANNNLTSQAIFGIQSKILTTGGLPLVAGVCVQGQNIRDLYLTEMAYPQVSKEFTSGAGQTPTVTVDCLGYAHLLNYPYNDATSGAITTTAKILLVLAADPNIAYWPYDVTRVALPAAAANVDRYEADNNLAWDVIMDCVARGDTNNARWLFGIYEDLGAVYEQAPTTVEYYQQLNDPAQRVTTLAGGEVPYWSVRPGKWLLYPDLLVGRVALPVESDPRAIFLESVTYTAPHQLQLTGGRLSNLRAVMAQLGLSGIGG